MTDDTTGPTNGATDSGADEPAGSAPDAEQLSTEQPAGEQPDGDDTTRPLGARARRRAARLAGMAEGSARPPHAAHTRRPSPAVDQRGASPEEPRREYAEAEHIAVQGGSIGSAMARSIAVERGALGRAQADEIAVTTGAIGGARATHVVLDRSMLGGAIAGDVRVRQGFVQGLIARDVSIEQGGARTVIGNHVTLGRQSGALIAIARTIDGEGRVLLDWRGAVAFGAVFAIVTAVLRARLPRR